MIFKQYSTYKDLLKENTNFHSVFGNSIKPEFSNKRIKIFSDQSHSPLVKKIKQRLENPSLNLENYKINTVSQLQSYNLDSTVFDLLLNIKDNGVGPGEILISLLSGKWIGGTQKGNDVIINGVGPVEVKYLDNFTSSCNVPMGSSENKNLENSRFLEFIYNFGKIIKSKPEYLKSSLSNIELDYFINNVLDQIYNPSKNLSTQSIRLIGKFLRNNKNQELINKGYNFKTYVSFMEESLKNSVGESKYIFFLGNKNEITDDINNPSVQKGGMYYILPVEKLKYYMFYRIYKKTRVDIAPFQTEKDFFDKALDIKETT